MMPIKYFRHFLLLLVLAVSGMSVAAQMPADEPGTETSPYNKQDRPELFGKAYAEGEVAVIIGLRVPQAENVLARLSTRALNERRSAISAKQRDIEIRLTGQRVSGVKRMRLHPYMAMRVDATSLARLLADPDVVSVEPDRRFKLGLFDTPAILHAPDAWGLGATGAGQAVAIVDSGVESAHTFLAGKVVAEACFSSAPAGATGLCPNGQASQIGAGAGEACGDYSAGCYHGTHVAGIASGKRGVLGAEVGGMAPDASLIAIQVFYLDCQSGTCELYASLSDMLLALEHVYSLRGSHDIAAVNMSLGGEAYAAPCDGLSPSMTNTIASLRQANIATVIASGNNSSSTGISFPACISGAVSVGSTTKQNVVSSFSNSAPELSLLATGQPVYSSLTGGAFGYLSGTSMATPHVAGAWAALRAARPAASVDEVLTALQTTGVPITDARNSVVTPLIQIAEALSVLANQPPTVSIVSPLNGATFTAPATVVIDATAADADGTISRVEFYNGANLLNTDTAAPYSFSWSNVAAGSYALTAKAYDNSGAVTTSSAVNITVSGGGGSEIVWMEDAVPPGAVLYGDEPWSWVSANPAPFSGSLAHQSALRTGRHQHHFNDVPAVNQLAVSAGDVLFTYIYLDPANMPSEIMLQWNDGTWEHRAYWGANSIAWGVDGTVSRRYMGPLPAGGQWARLEVPANLVGLEGRSVKGMAFTLYNGRATWDKTGKKTP